MNTIFLLSVLLKGIGAILEILIQILITKGIGVDGYGTVYAWINAADLIYWVLFSGIVRCNTFYLSDDRFSIQRFKKRYYLTYVVPLIALATIVVFFLGKRYIGLILAIVFLELLVQDQSSTLMARRRAVPALFGEYVLGRILFLASVALLFHLSLSDDLITGLVGMYIVQYAVVFGFFILQKKGTENTEEMDVPIAKLVRYQRADIVQSLITQAPVVIQFFFIGAFEAGVVNVVMLVKKLVNFISGPAAKVFLPEFSRSYQRGDYAGIRQSFSSIMRIQMLFIAPLSVALIGFPEVILHMFAEELLPYRTLFVLCSSIFLIAATLGPSAGLMQMTDHEKADNTYRECALVIMVAVFFLMRKNPYFVLYGLCVESMIESVGKYAFICRWMQGPPVTPIQYLSWWACPILIITAVSLLHVHESAIGMVICSLTMMVIQAVFLLLSEKTIKKQTGD